MSGSHTWRVDRPVFKAETADDLRELITQAELIVGNLRGAGPRAQTLLFLLDAIHDLLLQLDGVGIDLRAEKTRLETVERLLQTKDGILLREMCGLGGLPAAREAVKPAPGQWWWYLDRRVARRRQRQLRRILLALASIFAVFILGTFLYRRFFPPDPRRMAALEKTNQAELALQKGDLAGAVALYRQAAAITPDDPEIQVWIGVLEEQSGHSAEANQAYADAERLTGSKAGFLVARGMARLQVGALAGALADAQAATAAQPDMAEAYFLLGNVYDAQGATSEAVAAFSKAADLADKSNNAALVVMAKTRMGMLLQQPPQMPRQTSTPLP